MNQAKHLTRNRVEDRMVFAFQERSTMQEVMSNLAMAIFRRKEPAKQQAPISVNELAQIIQRAGGAVR